LLFIPEKEKSLRLYWSSMQLSSLFICTTAVYLSFFDCVFGAYDDPKSSSLQNSTRQVGTVITIIVISIGLIAFGTLYLRSWYILHKEISDKAARYEKRAPSLHFAPNPNMSNEGISLLWKR